MNRPTLCGAESEMNRIGTQLPAFASVGEGNGVELRPAFVKQHEMATLGEQTLNVDITAQFGGMVLNAYTPRLEAVAVHLNEAFYRLFLGNTVGVNGEAPHGGVSQTRLFNPLANGQDHEPMS